MLTLSRKVDECKPLPRWPPPLSYWVCQSSQGWPPPSAAAATVAAVSVSVPPSPRFSSPEAAVLQSPLYHADADSEARSTRRVIVNKESIEIRV